MTQPKPQPAALDQRETGRVQVLDCIRRANRIARIDIARETGLSPATVTVITSELLGAGLIEETIPETDPSASEDGGGRRGRPRVALRIRGEARLLAGLKVASRSITAILADFEGATVAEHTTRLPAEVMRPDELVALIRQVLKDTCASAGRALEDISGAGLGLSGIIDAPRNFVYWSPSLSERNVALGEHLDAALPFPFFLDNDANLVAKAEQLFGEGRGVSDFLVITIEQGVGMGIVMGGALYRGTRGCGAEFGHIKVQVDGALCRCGQRGCLEAYVGDYALLREARLRDDGPEDLAQLFDRAGEGDPIAGSILDRAGRMFAMGLANVINIFDPALVILAGERMAFDFLYADKVLAQVRASILQIDAPLPELRVHKWGDLMWAKGAAAYAMERVTEATIRGLAKDAA